MALAIAKPITVAPAKKHRLVMTCRFCGKPIKTWTRRGLRVTCKNPKCGRVQEGPAGIELMAQRLVNLQPARRAAQPLQVVAAPAKRRAAVTKPAPRAAAGAANGKAKPAPPSPPAAVPAQPPPAPAKPKVGLFDRLAFGVRD